MCFAGVRFANAQKVSGKLVYLCLAGCQSLKLFDGLRIPSSDAHVIRRPRATFLAARAVHFTFMVSEQLNGIAHMDLAAVNHVTIQREFATEFLDDLLEYVMILLERVGVKGGHDAATAQILHSNQNFSDAQAFARP